MTTKNAPSNFDTQKTFPIISSITQLAREIIRKRPGIYKGNLNYWILEKIPKSTKIDIELAFIQLLKEGYFFSLEDTVYPPNKVDKDIKTLTKFVHRKKLSFLDYGILYELHRNKKEIKWLSDFSGRVLSKGWGEDEKEIKKRIQELVLQRYIISGDYGIQINWEMVREVLG